MPSYKNLDLTNCVCLIGGSMMDNASNTPANTNANGYQVPCYQGESALATINPTLQNFGNGEGWISPEFVWDQDFLSNQQINFGNITNLNSASKYTIELWIKLGDITDVCNLYQKRIDNNNMICAVTAGGEMYIYTATGGAEYGKFTLSGTVSNDTYFHMVVVYDGTQADNAGRLKVFIDGVQKTLTFTGTIDSTTANLAAADFRLGGHANSLDNESAIDFFALYDDADTSTANNNTEGRDFDGLQLYDLGSGIAGFVPLPTAAAIDATKKIITVTGTCFGDTAAANGDIEVSLTGEDSFVSVDSIDSWSNVEVVGILNSALTPGTYDVRVTTSDNVQNTLSEGFTVRGGQISSWPKYAETKARVVTKI